ncbi:DUF6118 family protein [Sphingobium sp. H39-3-25]|uniref:DUF6118 family protein n=1 Tax=Sphingobium arseniciresistens TaxID=3030834 RepID=UPI0023B9352C|nr:DUF6118 family protein [Sphingobium arseniciresistens]
MDAGISLMRADNPEAWQAIVDAADMARENRNTLAACQKTAAKARSRRDVASESQRRNLDRGAWDNPANRLAATALAWERGQSTLLASKNDDKQGTIVGIARILQTAQKIFLAD